jgi:probable HAF family extracellular repeat protein
MMMAVKSDPYAKPWAPATLPCRNLIQIGQALAILLVSLVSPIPTTSALPPTGPSGIPLVRGSYGVYELGALGGIGSLAYDISEDGSITGEALDAAGQWHAFVWKDGIMSKLNPLSGGSYSSGRAISDAGLVGGVSGLGKGRPHARRNLAEGNPRRAME